MKAVHPLPAGILPENLDTLPLPHEEVQDSIGMFCVVKIRETSIEFSPVPKKREVQIEKWILPCLERIHFRICHDVG